MAQNEIESKIENNKSPEVPKINLKEEPNLPQDPQVPYEAYQPLANTNNDFLQQFDKEKEDKYAYPEDKYEEDPPETEEKEEKNQYFEQVKHALNN